MSTRKSFRWLRWFAQEFADSTVGWSFMERAIFRALLDVQWCVGPLPLKLPRMAEAIRCPLEELERAWPTIRPKLQRTRRGWINERLESERQLSLRLYTARVES